MLLYMALTLFISFLKKYLRCNVICVTISKRS